MANNKVLNVPHLRFPEFTGEWEKERLDNIATLSKGAGISKEQLSNDGESCILYGELYTKYKSEVIKNITIMTYNPCLQEQRKIAKLLSLLDDRIATQNKIIEDLKKLKRTFKTFCP